MGNNPPDDGNDALPPSFLPSSGGRRPVPRPGQGTAAPQDAGMPVSFQPRNPQGRPQRTRHQGASGSTGRGDLQGSSVGARRSSSSSRASSSPSPREPIAARQSFATPADQADPPSFQPRGMGTRPSPAGGAGAARPRNHASGTSGYRGQTGAASRPRSRNDHGEGNGTARTRPAASSFARTRRRGGPRAGRLAAAILAALLVAAAIGSFGAYNWVNGQLNHFDALTGMADGAESTWLIVGSDARDGTTGGSADDVPGERTDTIMLLIKPKSGPAALISIPRDSYVNIDGQDMKINAAVMLGGGFKALTGAVEQLTDTKVDHVVKIGFKGVKDVVDAIGGINVCYDGDVSDPDSGMEWTAGCHDVNGDQALAFARMRYQDPEGDIGRAKRQRQVIQKIAQKAASKQTLGNFSRTKALVEAGLANVNVDEKASPWSLVSMALAFRDATGESGITGTAVIANVDYWPDSGIGSTVLLDDEADTALFQQLRAGTHEPGTVGGTPAA